MYSLTFIPTIFFDCQSGWDPTNLVWAESAPDGNHSPQIGWGLDGIPIYGPYTTGGTVPKDVDNCGAHSHDEYGMHYHANFNGETQAAFLGCYKGARAVQDWDGSTFDDDGVLTGDFLYSFSTHLIYPFSPFLKYPFLLTNNSIDYITTHDDSMHLLMTSITP